METLILETATYRKQLLHNNLSDIFGNLASDILSALESKLKWVELKGDDCLFKQGDAGDYFYFVISGRLRAFIQTETGALSPIGDIVRGETVGEMAIFTGEQRVATVMAVRDSVLVQLSKDDYESMVDKYPQLSIAMTKNIIQRLNNAQKLRKTIQKPVNICFIPITEGVDLSDFSEKTYAILTQKHKVVLLNSQRISELDFPNNPADAETNDSETNHQLTNWLDEEEAKHDFMLYVADATASEWTKRCIRFADEIYLIANADSSPNISDLEKKLFPDTAKIGASVNLVLLHEADKKCPSDTDKWLQPRFLKTHLHIRPTLEKDRQRFARIMSGTAIGLVLAGGGAKGFAHLGVYKALCEANIPIDFVGGTSAGALMGVLVAFDLDPEKARQQGRKGAMQKPTSDFSLLPFMSIIKGDRMDSMLRNIVVDSMGFELNMEDTWLNFFAVSSNYTQAREEIHTHGALLKSLRASASIPGAFPPVISGQDLLVDGGTFNNFPTDVMYRKGAGTIIGVDLNRDTIHRIDLEELPSRWELLKDKFRAKKKKKYRLPSLMSILVNSTLLYSNNRRKEAIQYTDVFFNPEVHKFGLMNWDAFDAIFAIGYAHGKKELGKLSAEVLSKLGIQSLIS